MKQIFYSTDWNKTSSAKNRISIDNLVGMNLAAPGHAIFHCHGNDPQCQLVLNDVIAPGWYTLSYIIDIDEGKSINPKFYLDTGYGYNETEVIVLPSGGAPINKLVFFPRKVNKIRFDPTETNLLNFSILNLAIKKVSSYVLFKKIYQLESELYPAGNRLKRCLKSAIYALTRRTESIERLIQHDLRKSDVGRYQEWIRRFDSYTSQDLLGFKQTQANLFYRPKISILVPVYNTPLNWLQECIQSVLDQVYDNWELCIADDNSSKEEVRIQIREFAERDTRIKYHFRADSGHIAVASNTALSLATGEFIALLDHDDLLSPLALFRIAEALNKNSEIDFFYSDEDKIDSKGVRSLPFFKPDWSPALLYSQNYITHFACIRTSILALVDGFTKGSEGSQDYDLFLKVISAGAKVQHLPYILYHWRLHDQSTSMTGDAKPYAHTAGKVALEKFLAKKYPLHYKGVDDGNYTFTYFPRFNFSKENKVSIIIPTKDKIGYLDPCIESIISKSTWENYEILVLNNNSEEESSFEYFENIVKKYRQVRVINAPFEFNWSKLNNFGASHATGNFLVFLNNDVVVITPDWIERLCEYASLPDTAVVGPSLLYEDDTIQHAGVVVGMNGWADHVFKGMQLSNFPSPYISNVLPRNALAVTGACFTIERSKFETLGRFDESFIICGSDVEFCIRAYKKGFFNVHHGDTRLYHHESKSRGSFIPESDFIQSSIKYEPYRTQETDPFFNPNLSMNDTSPICKI